MGLESVMGVCVAGVLPVLDDTSTDANDRDDRQELAVVESVGSFIVWFVHRAALLALWQATGRAGQRTYSCWLELVDRFLCIKAQAEKLHRAPDMYVLDYSVQSTTIFAEL